MATRDTGQLASGITRRDFLKATAAATAVAGCGLEFAFDPAKAAAYENNNQYNVTFSTCPYCSASCGQRVVTEVATGKVVDIYGDFESPMNSGGLCAKGAGSLQLVNNPRRVGVGTGHAALGMDAEFDYVAESGLYASGVAYKRTGSSSDWERVGLDVALADIATKLKTARESDATLWAPASGKYNSKGVAFFGSSHLNNEQNYLYRKIIANFGTSNVEHQARI